MERATCPVCHQQALLSKKDDRTLLSHSVPRSHKEGCPNAGLSGLCMSCGFPVYKDGRGCKGAGRVAVEKRKGYKPVLIPDPVEVEGRWPR